MPRLFTGLEIPTEVADELFWLRGGLAGARWIDRDNYHITLRIYWRHRRDRRAGRGRRIRANPACSD